MRGTSILLILAGLVSGCGTVTTKVATVATPVEIIRTVTVPVPATLLEPCVVPELDIETNRDLESALAAAILELQRCTQDKIAISELE